MMPAWWGWAPSLLGVAFCFAVGAAIGSFLNVVAYRLPKGEGLFTPPSRCPACGTKLRWRENFPIFGWILLRGKCRACRTPISAQYPTIEFITAILFAFLYAAWFGETAHQPWFGGALRPAWAEAGIAQTWPFLALVFVLLGGLIAMTLIDARTFMIPLSIPWFVTAAALLMHPIHAAVVGPLRGGWTIPLPEAPPAVWASLGGMLGVAACAVLLKVRVIPRSFADFDAWAAEAQRKEAEADAAASPDAPVITGGEAALGPLLWRVFFFTGPAIALMAVGFAVGLRIGRVFECVLGGTALGLALGMFLRRFAPGAALDADSEPEWIRYPHARREATKEVLCLLCIGAFAALGWWLGGQAAAAPPLWVRALAGAALGYLSGGALVWFVRILGSIGFGKEAIGMGDVHLLAAVGAVLGWLDPILAFFTAPFFGLAWVALAAALARRKGVAMALPFGPHLAAATLAVIIAWPLYERLLHAITPPTLATP